MPTYDYECKSCGHSFDQFQRMSEEPLKDCPRCGEPALKRLVGGGIGVIFKGSGFYVNDSKPSSSKTQGETKKSGTTSGSNNGNGSADTSSTGGSDSAGSTSKTGGESSQTKTSTEKAG
ncbi:MAG: FmdB family zinc ribbon protein [Spirochaetota bacterium]